MSEAPLILGFPTLADAAAIKSIQDSWTSARVGSEGFLVHGLAMGRLEEIIHSRNALVARRGDAILAYLIFFRKAEWEAMHPDYAGKIDYEDPGFRSTFLDPEYLLIDYIARNRAHRGDAPARLLDRLGSLAREWHTGSFLCEISPDNSRSADFFSRRIGAWRIGSTTRDGVSWHVCAAGPAGWPGE